MEDTKAHYEAYFSGFGRITVLYQDEKKSGGYELEHSTQENTGVTG